MEQENPETNFKFNIGDRVTLDPDIVTKLKEVGRALPGPGEVTERFPNFGAAVVAYSDMEEAPEGLELILLAMQIGIGPDEINRPIYGVNLDSEEDVAGFPEAALVAEETDAGEADE